MVVLIGLERFVPRLPAPLIAVGGGIGAMALLGLGLRWDFTQGWIGRLSYEERWIDVGNASGTPSFGGLHLDVGSRF